MEEWFKECALSIGMRHYIRPYIKQSEQEECVDNMPTVINRHEIYLWSINTTIIKIPWLYDAIANRI